MAQPFKADSKSLNELFAGIDKPSLFVPPFQRGYSWDKKHVLALWTDLMEFEKEKSAGLATKYFLGPIVVLDRDGAIEVLDGQQRLATATILFSVIRDAAHEIGTQESIAFCSLHSDNVYRQRRCG